jgi:type VI secretion system secreted protein VgrG
MANFGSIIDWVLRLEDRTLAGKTEDLGDGAGLTRFGLTVRDEGAVVPPEYFTSMANEGALEVAKQVYYDRYWTPLQGTQIASDELAATLLSFAVNDGTKTAVELLQRVLGMQVVDGNLGPWTLVAISDHNAEELTEQLRDAQEARYLKIEAERPVDVKFDAGWRTRAYARYPDLP